MQAVKPGFCKWADPSWPQPVAHGVEFVQWRLYPEGVYLWSLKVEEGPVNSRNSMAASATLHCLTGCAIGEILGLMIGTALGLSTGITIVLAVGLAFLFGYALSTVPLIQAGLKFTAALSVVFVADTLSIAVMEIVDNLVMASIPGAMDAGLVNPVFWIGMIIALSAAFAAAFPVNRYLIDKGKGHALTHQYHQGHSDHQEAGHHINGDEHGRHGASGGSGTGTTHGQDSGDPHGHHH